MLPIPPTPITAMRILRAWDAAPGRDSRARPEDLRDRSRRQCRPIAPVLAAGDTVPLIAGVVWAFTRM